MDRWMQEALYHPEFGYYTAGIRDIGRGGDFTTWPELEGSLSSGIAQWVKSQPHKNHLIEIGAGTGALAASLLGKMRWWRGWWQNPHYHIVETSPLLQKTQKLRLRGKDVTWHESVQSALMACHGHATLIANELADAFPCRAFRKISAGWEERFVGLASGKIQDVWMPSPELPDSTVWNHPWREGQHVEVHESFGKWLTSWRRDWQAGSFLLVDYGADCPAIFQKRPLGTLRAYAHQQRFEGTEALHAFGHRDLTADVNFSDLRYFALSAGLRSGQTSTLADFLRQNLASTQDPRLLVPGGAGDAFQSLVLGT